MNPTRLTEIETQLTKHPSHPGNQELALELVAALRHGLPKEEKKAEPEKKAEAKAEDETFAELVPEEPTKHRSHHKK